MNDEQSAWLVQAMNNPEFYDHPVKTVEMLESHISWIFLAGDFAYKVKKPVNFGFLDFSTFAKRRHYCHEELRLNRNFASHLYLSVVQIGGRKNNPTLDGSPPLEYAVKMHRFPQGCQLDRMLAKKQLEVRHITEFAGNLAKLHQTAAPVDEEEPYGTPGSVIDPMLETFEQIRHFEKEATAEHQLKQLEKWTRESFAQLKSVLQQRKENGSIRECHGDVHLANMAWFNDKPLLFDCIEFNENLRWIDVINDIAFLVMDLDDRGKAALGWNFLNNYLQATGDYQGLSLLNFYKVYRAMVRAKVNCLRLEQAGLSKEERLDDINLYHSYLELALSYTNPQSNLLLITHGFSGSGKTTFASNLADYSGMLHLQSDRERKRLHDLAAEADTHSSVGGGIYTSQASTKTYHRLLHLSETVLTSGYSAIVDATFLQKKQRELFKDLTEKLHIPMVILDFPLKKEHLLRRIQTRGSDVSEATGDVLDYQFGAEDPLTADEKKLVIRIGPDTSTQETSNSLANIITTGHGTIESGA